MSIFLTSHFYLLLNWKIPKLAYEVKGAWTAKKLKNFNQANLKTFADDTINVAQMMISLIRLKTFQEKEDILVNSIFSFSFNVFKSLLFQGYLTLYHTIPTFNDPQGVGPFENIVEKENAGNQHFLLLPQSFLLFPKQISIFKLLLFSCLPML